MSTQFELIKNPQFTLEISESSSKYNLEFYRNLTPDDQDAWAWYNIKNELTVDDLLELYQFFNGDFESLVLNPKTSTVFTHKGISTIEIHHNENDNQITFKVTFDIEQVNQQLTNLIEDHFNYKL